MSDHTLLSIEEAAHLRGCTVDDIRRYVLEDGTLSALRVCPRGHKSPFELRGLRLYEVNELGGVIDLMTGAAAGNLRFERGEVVRHLALWAYQQASCVSLAELAGLTLGNTVEAPESAANDQTAPAQETAETKKPPVPVDPRPDPERRLALLRTLGGTAKYSKCEWVFTGMSALVKREKVDGRKRGTEKTIRADLKEAAQSERDASNAGFATGLGQR